jgi:hypothetical protein
MLLSSRCVTKVQPTPWKDVLALLDANA